jgi:hypothetical protein
MAALMGKDGGFVVGTTGFTGAIDSWSLNIGIGNAEISAYGDPARNFGYTIKEWSGNAAGTLNRSDTQQNDLLAQATTATPATVALRLCGTTVFSSGYWGGTAYIKGYNAGSDVAGKVSVTFDFQGTGNLAYSTSS